MPIDFFALLLSRLRATIELWCNGNTADFGSVILSSNLGSSTTGEGLMVAPFFVLTGEGMNILALFFVLAGEGKFELSLPYFCFYKAFCIFVKNILL